MISYHQTGFESKMSKFVINMIGGGFQHDICSSAHNVPKLVEWDKTVHAGKVSIHIDHAIYDQDVDFSKYNIAWFAESSAIIPTLMESLKSQEHLEYLGNAYNLLLTHDKRYLTVHPKMRRAITNACPWIEPKDQQIYPKTKLVSMIVSNKVMCPGHQFRQKIRAQLQGKVDLWGTGFNPIADKVDALKDYMFSIAMENDNYPGIFCEKITDCFVTGTIPIYWGDPTIGEFFDERGIIRLTEDFDVSQLTPKLYLSKMDAVKENFERTRVLPTAEDYIYTHYIATNYELL